MNGLSHRTAVRRTGLSAPARFLRDGGYLVGRVLDHGCGHGRDAQVLGCAAWDPHFHPRLPRGKFDTVLSTYVLNTLPTRRARRAVLEHIQSLLRYGDRLGCLSQAYVTVRNDRAALTGWRPNRTWQGLVRLSWPLLTVTPAFAIYEMKCTCRRVSEAFTLYGGIDDCALHGFGITEAECRPLSGWPLVRWRRENT